MLLTYFLELVRALGSADGPMPQAALVVKSAARLLGGWHLG